MKCTAAAYMRRFNRTSTELLEHTVRQTIPYGDVTNCGTSRLPAGTQTPTGGVRAGDRNLGHVQASRETFRPRSPHFRSESGRAS